MWAVTLYRVVGIRLIRPPPPFFFFFLVKMDFQEKMRKMREIERDPLHVKFILWACVGGGVVYFHPSQLHKNSLSFPFFLCSYLFVCACVLRNKAKVSQLQKEKIVSSQYSGERDSF